MSSPKSKPPRTISSPPAGERPYQVLVVDDDDIDRLAVRRAIRISGLPAEVSEADCGADAIARLRNEATIDCALLDYQLPDFDGLAILRQVRDAGVRTPIIMLTGHGNESLAVELMKAGAADYLVKSSISLEHLSTSIRNAVRIRRAEALVESAHAQRDRLFEQLHTAVESKDQALALLDALFATAPVGLAFFDPDLRYVRVNRALEEINGLPAKAHIGKTAAELFPGLPPTVMQSLRQVRITREPIIGAEVSGHTRRNRNQERYWIASYYPVVTSDGTLLGIGVVMLDITERKRFEKELKQARDAAEAANRAKDRFLAVLSHELRTPLAPVLSTVTALKTDPNVPAELRGSIEMIRRNVELEARLIDDLLDLTRIAKGKLQLNFETVDVHASLRSTLEICRSDIEAKQIAVTQDLRASRYHVRADSARLQQVLWNLVKNAVKFTPTGGTVSLCSENIGVESEGCGLRVRISDTGIGIEPDLLPKIFDAFEQGEQSVQRKFGGLGLGLAISKALMDLHGGTLSASSEGKDQGATFTVQIPSAVPPAPTGSCVSDPTDARGAASDDVTRVPAVRILMVDDHEDTGKAMQRLLERLGYNVRLAHTFRSAVEAAHADNFDLLISDIGLPDGSGLDLIRELRQIRPPIRGIALSGFGMEDDIRRSKEAGYYEHLTKPISFNRLESVIRELAASDA